MTAERRGIPFNRFGGLRLDLPVDEVGQNESIFLRDVDWDGSLGKVRCRDGFQKLKAAEATGPYKGLFAHSSTRMLAIKRVTAEEVKIVALDRECAEKVVATWTKEAVKSTFARFGTPSASYTFARGNTSAHKVVRFDGAAFTEPTATVDGVGAKEMPKGALMVAWPAGGNRLVVANTGLTGGPNGAASSSSHVWFSDPGNAESWHTVAPEANFAQLSPGDGEEITAMVVFGGSLFVFKETKFFVFYGVSEDSEGAPEFDFREVSLGDGSHMKRASAETLAETSDQLATAAPTGVYFCTTDGVYVTTGGSPAKISQALHPLEETSPFEGPMAEFLSGSTETFRWPAAGIVSIGQRLVVKRYEYLFCYDIPTDAWTCWKQTSVSLAVWTGLTGGGSEAALASPGKGEDSAAVGTKAWTGPEEIKTEAPASSATAKAAGVEVNTHYLKANTYGFAIPAGATIKGIQLTISRWTGGGALPQFVNDQHVYLVKGGVVQTTVDRAKEGPEAVWPAFPTTNTTYGSSEDLWGVAWTPADINASTFGAALSAYVFGIGGEITASVGWIGCTVYYVLPESSGGARPRLFATSGKSVYWTGPTAEEQSTGREALWQSGFYDLGSEDEKDLAEAKLWGTGNVSLSSYKDFSNTPGFTDAVVLGTGKTAQGRSHSSQIGTVLSHRLKLEPGASVQRITRYLKETRTATTNSGTK